MIWKNIELFNIAETEVRGDGAIYLYRFPSTVREAFTRSLVSYAAEVGKLTTGCELRFVGKNADVFLSADVYEGTVEIYRGDFFCRVERLQHGVMKKIELRENTVDTYQPQSGRFSPNVWRIVFDHDLRVVLHDVCSPDDIRPPHADEVPAKKLIAYGSSITHSACAQLFTNSYIYNVAKRLGADVLCKGMGGSCHIESEVADYLYNEEWDFASLELGINMVEVYPVSVFEERARHLITTLLKKGKPIVLISNFTSYHNIPTSAFYKENAAYVACLEKLYNELKCDNLYYIRGQEIVTEWDYLTADLLHPSPYGHFEMGRKIAEKIRNEFKIL